MIKDSWIGTDVARRRLAEAGYDVIVEGEAFRYKKQGVSGKIRIHQWGVDEWAILRLEDRGS